MTATIEETWDVLAENVGTLRLPREYCPIEPTLKQEWFLRRDELEVFFGGSAGPGKSWGLLMAALQYVDVPGYHALLLRPSLTEFEQQGGLMERAQAWLGGTDAWWHGGRREWAFPSGSTVRFGYLANQGDLSHYPGGGISFLGFDELTLFTERLYLGMFRLLRQPKDSALKNVPVRVRSASNPGNPGHGWVKSRFIDPASRARGAVFVPASISDNPHLDYETYLKTLSHMTPIDRMRLINGDWDVMEEGGKFHREDFVIVDAGEPLKPRKSVRYWDFAASEPSPSNPDPDYTVGLRLDVDDYGHFTVADIVRGRWPDAEIEKRVREAARADGRAVYVYIEQEPGSAGKNLIGHYKRNVLSGYACYAGLPRTNKEVRARPVAAAVANGLVSVVRGAFLHDFLDETSIFPNGDHDDIVDALSGAHTSLTRSGGVATVAATRARIPGIDRRGTEFNGAIR